MIEKKVLTMICLLILLTVTVTVWAQRQPTNPPWCPYLAVGGSVIPAGYELGDANLDGTVNIIDALLIAQYYVGILEDSDICLATSDVNCDATINIIDALLVAQYYVGLISEFPCH